LPLRSYRNPETAHVVPSEPTVINEQFPSPGGRRKKKLEKNTKSMDKRHKIDVGNKILRAPEMGQFSRV